LAVLSVVGLNPGILHFFRFLPLVSFYPKVIQAIEELESLSETKIAEWGETYKVGIMNHKKLGYKELIKVLQQSGMLKDKPDEVVLVEQDIIANVSRGTLRLTPDKVRSLEFVKDGERRTIRKEQFDPTNITRELRDKSESIFRRQLAYLMLFIIAMWLALNMYLRFFIYID